jgi:hypothetical protein
MLQGSETKILTTRRKYKTESLRIEGREIQIHNNIAASYASFIFHS